MPGRTMFQKIWDDHVVADLGDDVFLLHIDRHILHDLGGPGGILSVEQRGLRIRNPELTFATADHAISSARGRACTSEVGIRLLEALRSGTRSAGIRLFDVGEVGQGIVHVIGPELGLTQPGALLVCGDSHTCTHGGIGAMAFGIGTTELTHVLATQTLVQSRPRTMRVRLEGNTAVGVTAKDVILHLIGTIGVGGGSGYAVEYAGSAIRHMGIEERLTVCNLSIELGAKIGMVAPDEKTFAYLKGRKFSPAEELWDRATTYWRTLPSDDEAEFDREVEIQVGNVAPHVTWGTSPEQVLPVDGMIPDLAALPDVGKREAAVAALNYMGLEPGKPIIGTPVDWVFIGSCANSRISDLRSAAEVVRGRKVASSVRAWVVPGSESVKRQAEAEGLDGVFKDAGFEWREPGCSMCLAANGETVPAGQRSISTSNRNFLGRQGPGARTHLASPAMAAAAAIAGHIADVRKLKELT